MNDSHDSSDVSEPGPQGRRGEGALVALLARAARAHSPKKRLQWFVFFCAAARENPDTIDRAFVATQTARDLEVIDELEAAFVFDAIYTLREWEKLTLENPPVPTRHQASYYRGRGEARLAELMIADPERYTEVLAAGRVGLLAPRGQRRALEDAPSTHRTATFAEKILDLASTSERDAALEKWTQLKASASSDPRAALAAAHELWGMGVVSWPDAVGLMHYFLDPLVLAKSQRDREMRILLRRLAWIEEEQRRAELPHDAPLRVEHGRISGVLVHRAQRFGVHYLRQAEAHDLANLLLENAGEYYELVGQSQVGQLEGFDEHE